MLDVHFFARILIWFFALSVNLMFILGCWKNYLSFHLSIFSFLVMILVCCKFVPNQIENDNHVFHRFHYSKSWDLFKFISFISDGPWQEKNAFFLQMNEDLLELPYSIDFFYQTKATLVMLPFNHLSQHITYLSNF